jgi:hypothetical protein
MVEVVFRGYGTPGQAGAVEGNEERRMDGMA